MYVVRNLRYEKAIEESGDYSGEDTPVPISNTEVKLLSADDTWWETAWESRTLPVRKFMWLHGQAVKTPPFHGGNRGSIPRGVTIFLFLEKLYARLAELADAPDLGSGG